MSNDYEEQPEFDEFNSFIIWVRRSYNYDEIESDGIKTVEALKEADIKETEIKGVIEDDDVEELKKIIERYGRSY